MPVAALAAALALGWVSSAAAQAPAWPTDAPQQPAAQSGPAWPTDRGPPQGHQIPAPGGFGPPGGGAAPAGFGPPGAGAGPEAAQQACLEEFNRLRGDVDKRGAVAKKISERKGTRAELCTAMNGVFAAESKWVKFAKDRASSCGIPGDIIKQLGKGHDHLAQMRTQICSSGGPAAAGPARPPSLSEALGTAKLPDKENTTVRRGGTLDTLTGNPIR